MRMIRHTSVDQYGTSDWLDPCLFHPILCHSRYTMTKTSAVLFILFFSLVLKLEEPVSGLFVFPLLT